jgi:DNA-binding CsgD family transcriptional regulator
MSADHSSGGDRQGDACGDVPHLSGRQRQILHYLCRGYHNKTIAYYLGIEVVTVKMHIGQLFKKLGVNNRTAAAVRGVQLLSAGEQRRALEEPLSLPAARRSPPERHAADVSGPGARVGCAQAPPNRATALAPGDAASGARR